jgi:hypothetical protein
MSKLLPSAELEVDCTSLGIRIHYISGLIVLNQYFKGGKHEKIFSIIYEKWRTF